MAANTKAASKPRKNETEEKGLQILLKEYDALRDFYNQTEHGIQNLFNYYLTLMTAILGVLIVVFQFAPLNTAVLIAQKLSIGALLIFFATIGSLYVSSLSTHSAHAVRYARGINEIRKKLFDRYQVPVPPIYGKFMQEKEMPAKGASKLSFILSLFIPVSTYQLFVATVSSVAWAGLIFFLYLTSQSDSVVTLWRSVIGFIVPYLIYSIYARLVYEMIISRLNIKIGN
jgi:hypothetical protein